MQRRAFLQTTGRLAGAAALAGLLAAPAQTRPRRTLAQVAGQAPPVESFRGSYNGWSSPAYLGPVGLHAGLVVVRARHGGQSNFGASILTPKAGSPFPRTGDRYAEYEWTTLLINSAGRYVGAAAAILPTDGDYFLEVGAAGAYEFVLEQPTPANVTPVLERTFTGEAQDVTPVFALDRGSYTVRVTSPADLGLAAWLYEVDDLGGAAINGDYAGRFASRTSGPFDEATSFNARRAGLYMVAVDATSLSATDAPTTWTVTVE
jgi:hypothetical protein